MATINKNGTNGTNGTSGASPTKGTNGTDGIFTQNGKIGADSIDVLATGGNGGAGGNGTAVPGANGGDGGNGSITLNGNIFNAPASTTVAVHLVADGGNGGAGGTGTTAGTAGKGGNATVTANGNIFQPNKALTSIELDALTTGGSGSTWGNATSTINGNIFQSSKAVTTVTLDANAAGSGTNNATLNGNIVQGNISNVNFLADAAMGTATINGNIIQTNATNTGTVTLEASGSHIAITQNKFTLGLQTFDFTINPNSPYDTTITGNTFTGTGTNAFVFTDNANPGPHTDTVAINLATGTLVFDGEASNGFTGFNNITVSGTGVSANLTGSAGNDVLTGTDGNDTIDGGGGDDVIFGGKGNDTLTGGPGNDVLHGNDGNDVLDGGDGNDTLLGGAGDDILIVSTGTDILDGNTDPLGDTVDFRNATSGVTANLGAAQQNFTTSFGGVTALTTLSNIQNINGSNFGDHLTGDANNNTLSGGVGDDFLVGGGGNDTLDGGVGGTDTVTYSHAHNEYAINVDTSGNGTVSDNTAMRDGNDTLVNIEKVVFSDGTLDTASGVFTGTGPVNHAPTTVADSYTTNEDTALVVNAANGVLANDSDPDVGDTFTAALVTNTTHGALTLHADGSFSYSPANNYNGPDSFTYTATDNHGATSAATTVTLNVTPVNDPPVANADTYNTNEDTALTVNAANGVLANDSDVDGDTLSAALVSGPASASSFHLNADGSFTYTPTANFHGSDSFTYSANDGHGGVTNAVATITVASVNDAPVANNDGPFLTKQGQALSIPLATLLSNDTDVDGDTLTADNFGTPANGALSFAGGNVTYTPNAGFHGTDTFTYHANDGTVDSASPATVTITVDAPPVVNPDSYTASIFSPLVVDAAHGVQSNDTDADGDTLTTTLVTGPSHGSLTLNSDGSFTYTATGPAGPDSFTYTDSDGHYSSGPTTVSLNVTSGEEYFGTNNGDTHTGTPGDDIMHVSAGTDMLDGGANLAGGDTLTFDTATSGVTAAVNGTSSYVTAAGPGTTTSVNFENITGSAFNDVLTGDSGNNVINGGTGGSDTASFLDSASGVTASLLSNTATGDGSDTLVNIANLTGSNQADTLTGDANANVLMGAGGDDVLIGGGGNDTIDGGTGANTAEFSALPTASQVTWNTTGTPHWQVSGPDGTDTIKNVQSLSSTTPGGNHVLLVGGGGYATINAALAAASNGDTIMVAPGEYDESLLITKQVNIVGAGPAGSVIIKGTFDTDNAANGFTAGESVNDFLKTATAYTGDTGVTVNADNVGLTNLTVENFKYDIGTQNNAENSPSTDNSVSNLSLTGVTMKDAVVGFQKDDGTTLLGLNIQGGSVSDVENGVYLANDFYVAPTIANPYLHDAKDVTINGTGFSNVLWKGIYAETLQGATNIDNVTMNDVGNFGGTPVNMSNLQKNGNGIDVNLKFHTYTGTLDIDNPTLTNVGNSPMGGQTGAIVVEGRDDPGNGSYDPASGGHSADTSGLNVDISGGTIDTSPTGIRVGEVGKADPAHNLTGPGIEVDGTQITNTPDGEVENHSQSQMTIMGTSGNDTYRSDQTPVSTGSFAMYGGGGDDYLVGGLGNDTLQGGTGDDTLDGGGAGSDTADYSDATSNGLVVNLMTGTSSGGGLGNDSLTEIQNLTGSIHNDTLIGDGGDNVLQGGQGNDILYGHGGSNILQGDDPNLAPDGGTDVAYYSGRENDAVNPYAVSVVTPTFTAVNGGVEDVSDSLSNVERLKFLSPSHVSDVNNDGVGDLFFQNSSTGAISVNGVQLTFPLAAATTRMIGTGEFDPESTFNPKSARAADILLQDGSGNLSVLYDINDVNSTNSGNFTGAVSDPSTYGGNWKAITSGDFNGDGSADVLMQNSTSKAVEILTVKANSTDAVGFVNSIDSVAAPTGTGWNPIAAGDFNGDGKSDILWQNSTTKQVEVYEMDQASGGAWSTINTPVAQNASGLTAVGTGDFNNDGFSDILFKNASGQAVVWFMYGDTHAGTKTIAKPSATATVVGAEDVDNNGYSDILWTDTSGNTIATKLGGPSSLASATVIGAPASLGAAPGGFHLLASTGGG